MDPSNSQPSPSRPVHASTRPRTDPSIRRSAEQKPTICPALPHPSIHQPMNYSIPVLLLAQCMRMRCWLRLRPHVFGYANPEEQGEGGIRKGCGGAMLTRTCRSSPCPSRHRPGRGRGGGNRVIETVSGGSINGAMPENGRSPSRRGALPGTVPARERSRTAESDR